MSPSPYQNTILDHLTIGVAVCDLENFEFIEYNLLFAQWFDLDQKMQPFTHFLSENEIARLKTSMSKNRVFRYKASFSVNGRALDVDLHISNLRAPTAEPCILIQGVVNSAEQEIQLLIKNHEVMSNKINTQLIEEKDKAEVANKAKAIFLATISHELRTPLNAILGFSSILAKKIEDQYQSELISKVMKASRSLSTIIDSVLNISQSEQHFELEIKYETSKTAEIFDVAKNYYRQLPHRDDVSFECIVDNAIPESISTDSRMLSQLLMHLLSNAHKFTHKGSIKLNCSLMSNQAGIKIVVQDSGIGISDDFKPFMYDAFTQEDSSATRKYGGAGIGLSLSQNIAKNMLIELSCESKRGYGTSVTIKIPI